MKTYDVTVERDGAFWLIRVPELDGVTQARTRGEIESMARDYIAIVTKQLKESFQLSVSEGDQ